jgi:pilus assembly protein Flp/PilA
VAGGSRAGATMDCDGYDGRDAGNRRRGHDPTARHTLFHEGSYSVASRAMRQFSRIIRRLVRDDDGPTAVEYAVMLALVIALCLPTVYSIGMQSRLTFMNVMSSIAHGS